VIVNSVGLTLLSRLFQNETKTPMLILGPVLNIEFIQLPTGWSKKWSFFKHVNINTSNAITCKTSDINNVKTQQ